MQFVRKQKMSKFLIKIRTFSIISLPQLDMAKIL